MFSIREYQHKVRRLSDYLPWAALIEPGVLLNKDGSFTAVVRFRGPDLDSSTALDLIGIRARLNNALRRLGSRWCVHVEACRRPSQSYPQSRFPDPVTAAIDAERREGFETQGSHFETDYYLSLTYLTSEERAAKSGSFFIESDSADSGFNYQSELDHFRRQVEQVLNILRGFMPEMARLESSELLTYLHGCVSTRRHLKIAVPPVPFYLDEMLTDDELACGFAPRLGDEHLKVVAVHAYPAQTTPGLLDRLNQLPIAYRWVVRWLPMDKSDAEKHIGAVRRQWFAKRKGLMGLLKEVVTKEASALEDSDSVNKAQDADEALQYLGADLCSYGYLTLTVTVHDRDPDKAHEKAAAVQQVVDGLGLVSRIESVNAVEAWLGSLPAHAYADVRRPMLSSLTLCDLIPMSAVWSGPRNCKHLNGPVLMQTRTKGSTPFRLSLHQGDVGHAMLCGPTGAGKSTLLNILAAQWRRYPDAQVYFFDKGGSCKVLTYAAGGDFYDLGAEGSALNFQPLRSVDVESERVWARQWLLDILEREGIEVKPALKEEIWHVLEIMGSQYEVGQRTLSAFVNLVQSMETKEALRSYTLEGPYGQLLDSDQDNLQVGSWQAFEMERLMQSRQAMIPVLTYLFHRLEQRFASKEYGGRPTLLVLDEAWVFLAEGFFARKINEWLKVLRKRNVAVVFATQSLADIASSPIAPALIENCPTRIFLPNARALEPTTRPAYEAFGLNDRQLQILAEATPKQHYYYQSREGNRLFEVGFGELALAFCGASNAQDQQLADRIVQEHGKVAFAQRFLSAKGQAALVDRIVMPEPEPKEAVHVTDA